MHPMQFCPQRAQLTDVWIEAAREHAAALTRFSRSEILPLNRSPGYTETVERLRIRAEDALRALDQHRKQHGC
jgi:hypothetical protein